MGGGNEGHPSSLLAATGGGCFGFVVVDSLSQLGFMF